MTENCGAAEAPIEGENEYTSKGRYESAIGRVIARNRLRIKLGNCEALEDDRLTGLGSVVLGRLREVSEDGALDSFRLYAGLGERGELLLHRIKVGSDPEEVYCSFLLREDGALICESTEFSPEDDTLHRFSLKYPEDFLKISPVAVEAIYADITLDGFWDRLADKHANWEKPEYGNIWGHEQKIGARIGMKKLSEVEGQDG